MPNNKATGPNGFQVERHKELCTLLAPLFYKMVMQINTANISLLLQLAKDPTMSSSYHSTSVKTVDLKCLYNPNKETRMVHSLDETLQPNRIH